MASLIKNGKHYGIRWTDSKRHPRQVRESLKTSDRHKAIHKKKQLEWEYANGQHDPWKRKWYDQEKSHQSEWLTPSLVSKFIEYKSTARGREGWSEAVAHREKYVMGRFADMIGEKPVGEITKKELENFYYRDGVHSDHTRNGDYISVNTFLNWCISNGYLSAKPVFKPSKPQSKTPRFIYPEQLSRLIRYRTDQIALDIKDGRLKRPELGAYWAPLGWMVLAGTGLRPIELAQIKIAHIESGHILVGADFTTKVKAERRVPLLYEAKQAVDILTDVRYRSLEPNLSGSPYLLGRKPEYSKKQLSIEFSATWKACYPDKPKCSLYNLKDTFCVRFLSDDKLPGAPGMRLNELKDILGHASIATTEKYLKAVPYGTRVTGTIWDHPG